MLGGAWRTTMCCLWSLDVLEARASSKGKQVGAELPWREGLWTEICLFMVYKVRESLNIKL